MSRTGAVLALQFLFLLSAACGRAVPTPSSDSAAKAPAIDCRRDITAEDCAQAKASLQADASTAMPAVAPPEPARSDEARVAALIGEECRVQRHALEILEARKRGDGELLSEDERAQLPAEIERVRNHLETACK